MALIAGASQFAVTARLTNLTGGDLLTTRSTSLLSGFDGGASLLEIGKQLSAPGIGLSSRARAITDQFLAQSKAGTNTILSAGAQNTIDGANTAIKRLQASLPASKVGTFAGRLSFDEEGNRIVPGEQSKGSLVNTTA